MSDPALNGERPTFVHYLFNFATTGQPAVDKIVLAQRLGETLASCGLQLEWAVSYTSLYGLNPIEVGLRDAWMGLSPELRTLLRTEMTDLYVALELMCNPLAATQEGDPG